MSARQSRDPFEIYTNLNSKGDKRPLDWEESAVDSQSYVEGFHDAERVKPAADFLWVILAISFLAIWVRLLNVQIIRGGSFRSLADSNRIRNQVVLAPRGSILDSRGQPLVQNVASFNLVAIPFDLPKQGLGDEVTQLSNLFGLDATATLATLAKVDLHSFDPIILKQDLSQQESILFETRSSALIGFDVEQIPVRQYVESTIYSHILGYTGLLSQQDVAGSGDSGYYVNDFIGKAGLEQTYEKYLRGVDGQDQVEVDATGRLVDVLGEIPPVPGNTLKLNIDKDLQDQLYKDLTKLPSTKRAAAVAIDPKNGAILALISVPGYDNNLFAHGISQADYQKLLTDPTLPFFNRAIAGTYPPGSTVKPMVASAGLQENVINENTVIVDRGVLVIPNQFDPKVSYNFYGWNRGGLGAMTVRSAIALSSDIYFYTVAGGYPGSLSNPLGPERLAAYFKKFNLGQITGIDLPGEKPGLVPDPTWKAQYYKNDPILSKWYLGDTYHMGIGQGDVLVTPLQVAEWTATIANNGVGYRPEILSQVVDNSGKVIFQNQPQVIIPQFISPQNLKIVQEGMRQTITAGTGKLLNSLPITSAGKTGTSQFDGSDPTRTHAWFTAYAPYEDPQIAITVLVEAGGEGNAVAEPVVRDVLKWWADNRYKK